MTNDETQQRKDAALREFVRLMNEPDMQAHFALHRQIMMRLATLVGMVTEKEDGTMAYTIGLGRFIYVLYVDPEMTPSNATIH